MWKLKKIFETIIIFILIMLGICFIISFIEVIKNNIAFTDMFTNTAKYFLYTIGYGSMEANTFLENFLAMIGIIALALMSTFLTINLFWRLDDVKLEKKVLLRDNDLTFTFNNRGRTICSISASFAIFNTKTNMNIGEPVEYNLPILIKKSKWNLSVSLSETFWYQVVYKLLTNNDVKLYCIYSFVDTKSGQSSIKVDIFDKSALIKDNNYLNYEEFIKPITINNKNLVPIENGGTVNLINGHFEYELKHVRYGFVMALYNFKQNPLNLAKYNKDTTILECQIKSKEDALVTIEIKNKDGKIYDKEIKTNSKVKKIIIPLKEINGALDSIKEICYTVFNEKNLQKNELIISSLTIKTK